VFVFLFELSDILKLIMDYPIIDNLIIRPLILESDEFSTLNKALQLFNNFGWYHAEKTTNDIKKYAIKEIFRKEKESMTPIFITLYIKNMKFDIVHAYEKTIKQLLFIYEREIELCKIKHINQQKVNTFISNMSKEILHTFKKYDRNMTFYKLSERIMSYYDHTKIINLDNIHNIWNELKNIYILTRKQDPIIYLDNTIYMLFDTNISKCSICWYFLHDSNIVITKCKHTFHYPCIAEWNRTSHSCPLCRQDL
jgi:hypothetical protein